MSSKLALIVAASPDGGIGYQGGLPWKLPGDLPRFKKLTLGNVLIIGRRTDESLGCRPLPGRVTIVVSSKFFNTRARSDDYWEGRSVREALLLAAGFNREYVFFAGGAKIYEAAMPLVEEAFVTVVHREAKYDTYVVGLEFRKDAKWSMSECSAICTYDDERTGFKLPSHTYQVFKQPPRAE